ncbi:MAG TPA: hypothetical protein VGE20_02510 [Ramlibacter sp.]
MQFRPIVVAAAACAILAACGGGGSGDGVPQASPPPAPTGPAATLTEGLYLGPKEAGTPQRKNYILVLEGGETWVYKRGGAPGDDWFFAQGTAALMEQTSATSGTATGSGAAGEPLVAGKFGTDAALISSDLVSPQRPPGIAMTLGRGLLSFVSDPTADGKSTSLTLAGQPKLQLATRDGDGYDYQKPASLANLLQSSDGAVKVDATGVISSAPSVCYPSRDCAYDGALTPRPGGKNVFNLSLTVTGDRCTEAGSYSGVAYQVPAGLQLLAINAQKTQAVIRQLAPAYICF